MPAVLLGELVAELRALVDPSVPSLFDSVTPKVPCQRFDIRLFTWKCRPL